MRRKIFKVRAGKFELSLGQKTCVMGIINMTPDSFSQDGIYDDPAKALKKASRQALRMIREGADILDVGGESSRPGSGRISIHQERERVIPLVKVLASKINIPISVDTYKPQIAREALEAGASIINTIKGLNPDKSLLKAVRDHRAAIILMHMRGHPKTMQKNIAYRDVVSEIIRKLEDSVDACLKNGLSRNQIIIDPGIGFGKTVEHNLEILRRLPEFKRLNCPILIGASRKSFIGHITGAKVGDRLPGSLAVASIAVKNGVHIIRVHDVFETVQSVRLLDAI